MSQQFDNIGLTEKVNASLSKLLGRDLTAVTMFSGTAFPQNITTELIGVVCNRTDLRAIYYLKSVDPIEWELILDYSSQILSKEEIEAKYQPLASNLTLLSKITPAQNTVPYFSSPTSISSFTLTDYTKTLLQTEDAGSARTTLQLGALATKDSIDGGTSDIVDHSITKEKLAFTPISSSDVSTTGDAKESLNSEPDEGWIIFTEGTSIGDANSGATNRANADTKNLFVLLWALSNTTVQTSEGVATSKGTSGTADFENQKRLVIPKFYNYNEGAYIFMRL